MLPVSHVSILLIANSVIKSTRSIQSGTAVTTKSMQTIVTNAGGVELAESSTIAGSLNATLPEAHVKKQDHCDTDMYSNRASATWLDAKRKRQTFQFPHDPCQRRHLLLDDRRSNGSKHVSMTTRSVRLTRRKTFVCKIGPTLSLARNKNRFGVR